MADAIAGLTGGLTPQPALPTVAKSDSPAKIQSAAQQFEAILLEQILTEARGGDSWLGSDSDSANDCATSLAEQQLATVMAKSGGMGLGKLIGEGLTRASHAAQTAAPAEATPANERPPRPNAGTPQGIPLARNPKR